MAKKRTKVQQSDVISTVFFPASKRLRRAILKARGLTDKRSLRGLVSGHVSMKAGETLDAGFMAQGGR